MVRFLTPQDAQDLFLGNYQVDENEGLTLPSSLKQEHDWKFYAVSSLLWQMFDMIVDIVLMTFAFGIEIIVTSI